MSNQHVVEYHRRYEDWQHYAHFDTREEAEGCLTRLATIVSPNVYLRYVPPEEDVFAEAGLSVMRGVIEVLLDRESVPSKAIDAVARDAEFVTVLYDRYIGPAIDALERHLLAVVNHHQS